MDVFGKTFFWADIARLRKYRIGGYNRMGVHTEYVGWAITAGIPVKFCTAHGRSRPEVDSTKRIDVYGSKGASQLSRIFGKSVQNVITSTDFLRPKHHFSLRTVCTLGQYLPNGNDINIFLS